jgi:hypothetical protein
MTAVIMQMLIGRRLEIGWMLRLTSNSTLSTLYHLLTQTLIPEVPIKHPLTICFIVLALISKVLYSRNTKNSSLKLKEDLNQ